MTRSGQVAGSRHEQGWSSLGLDETDAALYAALVRAPQSGVGELAAATGLDPAGTEAAVARLVAAGAARRTPGGGLRYRAVSPDLLFGPRLAEREAEIRTARETVRRLEDLHRAGGRLPSPSDLVEVVVGSEEIGACVDRLMEQSRRRICGFDKPPYVHEPGSSFMAEVRRLHDGVALQVVYDPEAAAWPGRMERDILPSVRAGEQARISDAVPIKLMLFDDEVAVLPVVSGGAVGQAAFVVRSTAMVAGLRALFEMVWAGASPVSTEPVGDDVDFGPVLTLLAAGQTDAGIARAMGWSERTTQRRVQRLLVELGVRTRFQAGLAARDRGWLG
ncbi:helix-turn-helix domain-containing protein [Jatrophihabitans sp. YIM 134969]